MISLNMLFENIINKKYKIKLIPFDVNHFKTINDNKNMHLDEYLQKYTNINSFTINGNIAGMVGYIKLKDTNYAQISIHQDYRGKGLLKLVYDELSKVYKLNELFATIDKNNYSSIKSHLRAGFEYLPPELENIYKNKRPKNTISLLKKFN